LKKGKTALLMMLAMLFAVGVTINLVSAQQMTVAVDPASKVVPEAEIGTTFEVKITIADAASVAGLQFYLSWNSTILNATEMVLPAGHFMTPDGDTENLWVIVLNIDNDAGTASYGVTFMNTSRAVELGYAPKSGDGTLATITFVSKTWGVTTLHLYEVIVGDIDGEPLPHVTIDGEVTVLPEFPAFLLLPVFMIATLVAIIITKRTWLRKTRH